MKKCILIVLSLLVLAAEAVFLLCCNQEGFTGSRVKRLHHEIYLSDARKVAPEK